MFTNAIKKMKSFLILSTLLLLTAIPSTISFADPADDTTMWQIVWHSDYGGSVDGIFVQLTDTGKYYVAWYGNPVVTGYMNMTTTPTSFQGQTYQQSNGDSCAISGTISGSKAYGNYSCISKDLGTLTAVITVGKKPTIS